MNDFKDHLWACILAGGGGTRLWPLSREKNPKQFIKLLGNKTLLQVTTDRFAQIVPWEHIFVVTTSNLYGRNVKKELPKLPSENILIEPAKRNTAAAHGLAAAYIIRQDPDAVILNEYADHFVQPTSKYNKTYLAVAEAAYTMHHLAAIGIEPEYPHTGMGHIKIGKVLTHIDHRPIYKVEKFVEKPPLELAKKFTESGNYLWNGGMYVWRADDILQALKNHTPKIGHAIEKIKNAVGESSERTIINQVYKTIPSISVDYAVSEREKKFIAIKADFRWIDVGDWQVVWGLTQKDKQGNASIHLNSKGQWVAVDTSNTLVQTDKLLIGTVGVKDLIIIETDDAILVADKNKAQMVKELVNSLKERQKEEYL